MTTTGQKGRLAGTESRPVFRGFPLWLGVPLVATIVIAIVRGSRHFSWDWPVHAHHHLLANIATAVGLSVIGLLVLAGPMRQGEGWAWWGLVTAGTAIFGGYWLGNLTVGLGIDPAVPNTAQAILTVSYAVGLVFARRAIDRTPCSRTSSSRR